jgi:hypothetical protein
MHPAELNYLFSMQGRFLTVHKHVCLEYLRELKFVFALLAPDSRVRQTRGRANLPQLRCILNYLVAFPDIDL